jgi:Xaa-Pro aminopeptidase
MHDINPSSLLKACKSDSEIAHVKNAMRKDGVALAHFFSWLEQALEHKDDITELTIAEKLLEYRSQQLGFIGESFATIAGFNENGALPHYHATQQSFATITGNGLLLIDSGGQYEEGTTDITRMVAIGELTAAQKRDCTLVLKAHIALAQAVFPEGIAAPLLDALARQALWQQQLDYRHGTGHGVGFALNVHEGPQILSYYAPCSAYNKMRAGMITSNEPGLYHEGQYGIRIENLVVNRLLPQTGAYGDFLAFENLTLCPIATQCLDVTMLTANEKKWLNAYHLQVRAALAGELSGAALDWLLRQTEAVA